MQRKICSGKNMSARWVMTSLVSTLMKKDVDYGSRVCYESGCDENLPMYRHFLVYCKTK